MKYVIAGGSGQLGTILARHFQAGGHDVVVLARNATSAAWRTAVWDGRTLGPWVREVDGCDVLLNLAGRSVNCRYNERNRAEIIASRVRSTNVLHEAVAAASKPPAVWLNASTATIYRHALDRPMDESTGEFGGNEPDAPKKWAFSIKVAKEWEAAFFATPTPRTRRVALRISMIFSPDRGGIFDVLLGLVRRGLGGTNYPGTQYVSWIHDEDLIRAVDFLIEHAEMEGAVNIVSPHPIPNRAFMAVLRNAWGTRIGLPTWPLQLEIGTLLMRTESELVMKSRRVVPGRLLDAGFAFRFPHWDAAAVDLVARWRGLNG